MGFGGQAGENLDKKPTIGQQYIDNFNKNRYKDLVPASDLTGEMLTDYEQEVWTCYYREKHKYKKDFALVVLFVNKDRSGLKKAKSAKYFTRHTAPTPDFDQIVYWCHIATDHLEYLWTIPDVEQCMLMYQYRGQVPKEEWSLLKHVLDFADGSLLELAKKLNNEESEIGRIIITENLNG
jgi:hypothetical protein